MQFIPTTKLARKREECIPVELEISGAFPKLKFDVGSESEFQCGVGSASECEHGHETKFESELYNRKNF